MKAIKETRIIEEVKGYEAMDGTFFYDECECKKYEESARAIITARAKGYMIYSGSQYDLYDELSFDNGLEIYDIKDADAAKAVAQYVIIKTDNQTETLFDKYIGNKVILNWSYDEEYCWWFTLDEFIKQIKANYTKMIIPKTEEKK